MRSSHTLSRSVALILLLLSLLLGSLAPWDNGGIESLPPAPTPTATSGAAE
ncbi:MAG: hypothetical protein M3R24_15035 [Chloroflexota bacterium]|nr:hypothetical protein [Chloroflexota bacterium]